MKPANIDELDASDLSDVLTNLNGEATKVKNAVAGRKQLRAALEENSLTLVLDEDGNFELKAKEPVKKTKAGPTKPAPEEEEEETEEEEEEVEEEEVEEEPAPPPPPKKKSPPTKVAKKPVEEEEVPAKKVKKAAPANGAKRAPPPREASHDDAGKIVVEEKDRTFKEGSIREGLWAIMRKSKTVGEYMKKAEGEEALAPTARGFLNVAVKDGWISIG